LYNFVTNEILEHHAHCSVFRGAIVIFV